MSTTTKRFHWCLSAQDARDVQELVEHFGETQSGVMRRAILFLHYVTFNKHSAENILTAINERLDKND
jgi:hypothetical protein